MQAKNNHFISEEFKLEFVSVPYLPHELVYEDLDKETHLLLSSTQLALLNQHLNQLSHGRNTKKNLKKYDIPYSIIKYELDERIFALYKGGEKAPVKGTNGKVKYAQDLKTGEWYALKIFKNKYVGWYESNMYIELGIPVLGYERKDSKTSVYEILIPLAHGRILNTINLTEIDRIDLMLSVCRATHCLHEEGFIHTDLKHRNIFYHIPSRSATLVDLYVVRKGSERSGRGTKAYMAPEVKCLKEGEKIAYSEKMDIYSLGKTFKILNAESKISQAKDEALLIADMMQEDPESRPTLPKIIEQIETIRENYIKSNKIIRKIAWLDVQDFSKDDYFEMLLDALYHVNEICLIDSNQNEINNARYSEICHFLETRGHGVHHEVLRYNPDHMHLDLNNGLCHYEKKDAVPPGSYHGVFINFSKEKYIDFISQKIGLKHSDDFSVALKNLKEEVSDPLKKYMVYELSNLLCTLEMQHSIFNNQTSKHKIIHLLIDNINHASMTYDDLHRELSKLKQTLIVNSFPFFNRTPDKKTEKTIKKIHNYFLMYVANDLLSKVSAYKQISLT